MIVIQELIVREIEARQLALRSSSAATVAISLMPCAPLCDPLLGESLHRGSPPSLPSRSGQQGHPRSQRQALKHLLSPSILSPAAPLASSFSDLGDVDEGELCLEVLWLFQ